MYAIYQFVFVQGGPVMYPIVLGSVIALALFIERLWVLRRDRVMPRGLHGRVISLVREGKLDEAVGLCTEDGSAVAIVMRAGLREAGKPRAEVKDSIMDAGRREVSRLEAHIDLLGTIAAVEPLLGLLGTVTGLIRAFQQVETLAGRGVGVNPGALASGIWEALITTAGGLMIGIPAYLGYRYLQGRVTTLAVEMEESALEIGAKVAEIGSPATGAAAPQAAR
jgi:biopolymer transport protein ExbB